MITRRASSCPRAGPGVSAEHCALPVTSRTEASELGEPGRGEPTPSSESAWPSHRSPTAELKQIEDQDPALGELSRLAYLCAGKKPPDPAADTKAFLASFDFSTLRDALPAGVAVDAAPGAAGRDELPFKALVSHDHYARTMTAGTGTTTAHGATINGHDVHIIYTTMNAGEAYLEVFGPDEQGLLSARLEAAQLKGWDPFFARSRPSYPIASLADARWEDGMSEPAAAIAAGQLPLRGAWTPGVVLDQGAILREGSERFVALQGAPAMTEEQTRVAYLAMEHLQAMHFKNMDWDLELGRSGTLSIGHFTRPDDGKLYLIADWKDADDSSFTLYFDPSDAGPVLAIKQHNG